MDRRLYPPFRRGSFLAVPRGQRISHPSNVRRSGLAALTLRRGSIFVIPPAVVVAGAAQALSPQVVVRRRLALVPARWGAFQPVPLPQAIGTQPPAWVPQPATSVSRKPRILPLARRGSFLLVPRAQRAPHPGGIRQQKRLLVGHRGSFLLVPPGQRVPHPSIMRRHKRALAAARHGVFLFTPRPAAAQLAPWPPVMLRGARRPIAPIRRGVVFSSYLIGTPPAVTTRGQMTAVARQTAGMTSLARTVATMRGV